MTVHWLPLGRVEASAAPAAPAPASPALQAPPAGGGFARVYELEAARSARRASTPPPIPQQALEEMQAASRLYDELRAQGRQVRFDAHRPDGRVVAELCDTEGNVVHPISLTDVVHLRPDPDPAA